MLVLCNAAAGHDQGLAPFVSKETMQHRSLLPRLPSFGQGLMLAISNPHFRGRGIGVPCESLSGWAGIGGLPPPPPPAGLIC